MCFTWSEDTIVNLVEQNEEGAFGYVKGNNRIVAKIT
jgi:hypothetical protein